MPKVTDAELMMFADGELDPAEASELERQLGAVGLQKIQGIKEVGELVRGHLELSTDAAEPRLAGLWDLVERRLATPEPDVVVPVPAPAPSWFEQLRGWLYRNRAYFVTGTLSAGAVATVALLFRSPTVIVRTVEGPVREFPTPALPVAQPAAPEIESLEVSGGTGMVFTIEDDEGGSDTAVIWITPDDVVEGI